MKRRSNHLRGSVAAGLAIALLLLVIGTALAVVATMNLNLAATEEFNVRAEELARAGINQFLADMEKGYLDFIFNPAPSSGYTPPANLLPPGYPPTPPSALAMEKTLETAFMTPPTDFAGGLYPDPKELLPPNDALRRAALADATGQVPFNYPMPWAHLEGYCFITFNPASKLPYSTWNLLNSAPLLPPNAGYNGRTVPAYSLDLICTAKIGSHVRHLACRVTRRWDYAVACAQQIFISSTAGFPTRIYGNVYTRNAPVDAITNVRIHEGWQYNCNPCCGSCIGPVTTGTVVRGDLVDTSPKPCSIAVAPGNSRIGQRCNYKLIHFPFIENVTSGQTVTQTLPCPPGGTEQIPTTNYLVPPLWTSLDAYIATNTGLTINFNTAAPPVPGPAGYPTGVMPDGTYFLQDSKTPTTLLIENVNTIPANGSQPWIIGTDPTKPNEPVGLPSGNYFLTGYNIGLDQKRSKLYPGGQGGGLNPLNTGSQCTGIKLNHSVLYIVSQNNGPGVAPSGGSIGLQDGPAELIGISSALICDGDLIFKWGFVESDIGLGGGLVVKADRILAEAGGDFRGLVVAKKGLYLGSMQSVDMQGICCCGEGCGYLQEGESHMAGLDGGGQFGDGCFCLGICPDICGFCGAKAPVCAGTYRIGTTGGTAQACTKKLVSTPKKKTGFVTTGSETTFAAQDPNLNGGGPDGLPAVPGANGAGVFPLRVTGAVLAPYGVDPNTNYAFWLRSVLVKWDPQYLNILHEQAPIAVENWEVIY